MRPTPCPQAGGPDGTVVAVKALSLRRMTDWKQLELFEREAQTLKSLDHRGIPKYIDYLSEDTEKDRGFFLVQACPCFALLSAYGTQVDRMHWPPSVCMHWLQAGHPRGPRDLKTHECQKRDG